MLIEWRGREGEGKSGCWMLDAGYWILDAGYWMLDTGYWILDTGCWILDADRMEGERGSRKIGMLDT
ncbi:MAG: hypothetical protein QNJ58_15930 [Desulfobacterales bacterium]|nr:hypothetical protein [Desulfobacterales bacterium]